MNNSERNELTEKLLGSDGWESLEQINNDPNDKNYKEALELAGQIHNTFREGSGKYTLEYFIKVFLTKPIVRPGEDAYAQGIREGRADVIRQILQQIEFSKTGEAK